MARIFHESRGIPMFGFLRDYIVKRQREGAFRDCDPGAVVFALVGMPTYYAIVRRLFGLNLLKASDGDVIATFSRLLLDGLRSGCGSRNEEK